MFRKIFFIFVSVLQIQISVKGMILLTLSFISHFLIIIKQPFVMQRLNNLESKSSFAAFFTLFIGNLYICDISDSQKAICFVLIIITNTYFFCGFLFDVIYLLLTIHYDNIYKISPKIALVLARIFVGVEELDFTRFNLKVASIFLTPKQNQSSSFTTKKARLIFSSK